MKYLIIIALLSIILFGCVGEDSLGIDNIPPEKPKMIQHLGDSGDIINGIPDYNFYEFSELEENGIDAVSDGNKIKIEWEHLLDSDIDYIRILRFTEQDYLADSLSFASVIDSIDYVGKNYYRDEFLNMNNVTNITWFYFIESFDTSGNSTFSDTVCYKLLEKPLIISPSSFSEVASLNEITFEWSDTNAQNYRILLFNENRDLLWCYNPLDQEEVTVAYDGEDFSTGNYIFRIDAFKHTTYSIPINGKVYLVHAGAESEERVIIVE